MSPEATVPVPAAGGQIKEGPWFHASSGRGILRAAANQSVASQVWMEPYKLVLLVVPGLTKVVRQTNQSLDYFFFPFAWVFALTHLQAKYYLIFTFY